MAASQPLRKIRENSSEATLLQTCSQQIAQAASVVAAFEFAAHSLRQLIPATVYAFYELDAERDGLVCRHVVGDSNRLIPGLTIPLGERVTGWAGANRKTAMNSDASLDLAQIAREFQPNLRSAMSTPLAQHDRLLGVFSAYSLHENSFTDSHRYIFENVCATLSARICTLQPTKVPQLLPFRKQKI
jgi:GAF domain-containing protein